jgi:hypothetical protein
MKTNTEMQALYIASQRKLIEKKMLDTAKIVASNTMRIKDEEKFGIELNIGSAMGGISIIVYKNHKQVEFADCYGVYWPFENIIFFHKERLDRDVTEKLKELQVIYDIAKKYFDLNNK